MILVTGATGSIGRLLFGQLRETGTPVRALARDKAKAGRLGGDYVLADFDDPGTLSAALRGVTAVFLNAGGALPVAGPQPMIQQQINVIDAAVSAGVKLIVKVSVWGAHEGGKLAEGAHWEIEQHLQASGLGQVILSPSGFMQNFFTGAGSFSSDGRLVGVHGTSPVSYIDCYDIARVAAKVLTEEGHDGRNLVLTGPEALTQPQIAAKLSAGLGRAVEYVDLTADQLRETLTGQGLPASFADDIIELWAEIAAGSQSTPTDTVRRVTGSGPRTFDDFIAANRAAFG